MTRVLWIVGLSVSLLVFGGFTVICITGLILRHHLNSTGIGALLCSGFISWMVIDYLILKIQEPRKAEPASFETDGRI